MYDIKTNKWTTWHHFNQSDETTGVACSMQKDDNSSWVNVYYRNTNTKTMEQAWWRFGVVSKEDRWVMSCVYAPFSGSPPPLLHLPARRDSANLFPIHRYSQLDAGGPRLQHCSAIRRLRHRLRLLPVRGSGQAASPDPAAHVGCRVEGLQTALWRAGLVARAGLVRVRDGACRCLLYGRRGIDGGELRLQWCGTLEQGVCLRRVRKREGRK